MGTSRGILWFMSMSIVAICGLSSEPVTSELKITFWKAGHMAKQPLTQKLYEASFRHNVSFSVSGSEWIQYYSEFHNLDKI